MAVMKGHEPVTTFEQWYDDYGVDERTGCLEYRGLADCAMRMWRQYEQFKREMDARVTHHWKLEKLAAGEVISSKPDLPNVSSGETAGLVRRTARNLVQNTPNVEVLSKFDDDSLEGVFSRHILTTKIIGTDEYSNDMQQNLFASTKASLTLGFDCVVPVLCQDSGGGWGIKYDTIHYRDVFPDPGVKDIRQSQDVFIRRYLTVSEVCELIESNAAGWDPLALKLLLKNNPRPYEEQSVSYESKKQRQIPEGYEIITWYSSSGRHFLTFDAHNKTLLRIEKNKHPLKEHPVFFLVLEKDPHQPLGKSQVELLVGRQDFQDLMLNGAMKLWYRNINPSIIGYGTVNSIPNLSPGKYTQISNPNAKLEAFEVNTQTLMQYGTISQQNLGSMVSLVGAADQQMATQAGNGMSATPQGVEAQEAMVDITTNNYQKAIESFFSHYCSYALTLYFHELAAVKAVQLTAESRSRMLNLGMDPEVLKEDGTLEIDFSELATEYWVRCVPGSLVEMEDEKELRLLNQMFVPLSQAMPALAAAQDPESLKHAAIAMKFIIEKQIELSGSGHSKNLYELMKHGDTTVVDAREQRMDELERGVFEGVSSMDSELEANSAAIAQLQEQMSLMVQNQQALLEKLGVLSQAPAPGQNSSAPTDQVVADTNGTVMSASA